MPVFAAAASVLWRNRRRRMMLFWMLVFLAGASDPATLCADGQQEPAKAAQSAPSETGKPKPPEAAQQAPASAPSSPDQTAAKPADTAPKTPQQQLQEDCASLEKMSRDLKAEMDRTPPDALSLAVIHKALAIEQLSHKIQEEMKDQQQKHSAGEPENPAHDAGKKQ